MRYLLLLCGDETAAAAAGPEMARRCHGWAEEAERQGVRQAGTGLAPPAEAKTIRVRDGEVLLTDGPFAETKEQIGGYNVLECADRSTAVEVASRHPWAEVGTLELREIPDVP
ncbi:YciI family protein [Amycolatopsis sp. OK19-0408]|uniref:YciI family protein n=1 Tax=Amycolatopsis iheyensis TaxID=2945988 RepID=A0A9X2SHE6_9PSEU|nr:YciI family protein [Amycolatopsis iheyensis]MCR6481748.1 YciI family protein [Amycolatopsis iheyensis]